MRNYGLKIEEQKPEDYVFGGASPVPFDILQPNGDWTDYTPEKELQSPNGFESYACATFATLNAIETLIFKQYGIKENFSDRFLAAASGTKEGGNSPHVVAEYIRKVGLILEGEYPYTKDIDTFQKYYGPIPPKLYEIAREFLDKYDFLHEYVTPIAPSIEEALTSSPLGVSVYAWVFKDGKYIHPQGVTDNHWVLMTKWNKDSFTVFDTYSDGPDASVCKEVAFDYMPAIIKRYWIQKKEVAQPIEHLTEGNWLTDILKNLWEFIRDILWQK